MLKKHKKLTRKEMKKDPLLIFTAQAYDFIRNEWIKIGSTVLTVVIVITLALVFVKGRRRDAINAYDVALTALNNDSPEALDLLKRVVDDYSGSSNAADALIKLGNSYYNKKDFDSSEKYFKKYIDTFSDNPIYVLNAYNGLGGIYEEKGEYRKAGEMYEQYIKKYSNSVFLSMMYLNAGKAYFFEGNKIAARRNFKKIAENYIDSREKQEALYYLELLK